jgi:hypothetical protein
VNALTSLALCLTLSSVFASAQMVLTDDDAAKLISHVKRTPASQLDSALPPMTFEKWLLLQAGRDAAIDWVVRSAVEQGLGLPYVEADVSIQGRPGIVLMIANGTSDGGIASKPIFHSLQLVRADEYAEWPRLRDLPAALKRARASAR